MKRKVSTDFSELCQLVLKALIMQQTASASSLRLTQQAVTSRATGDMLESSHS